jgi:predicted Rossmann fold nucleotide-binding protein DprA/Smf involved in DNA uptake
MRIGNQKRDVVKQQILDVVDDKYQSTFQIATKIGRSWEFTNEILIELEKQGKVSNEEIGNIMAWKKA